MRERYVTLSRPLLFMLHNHLISRYNDISPLIINSCDRQFPIQEELNYSCYSSLLLTDMINNILIVDGDRTMLQTLTGLLKCQGGFLDIHTATDNKMALEMVQTVQIRVVITTLRAEEPSRFELVTRLSREYPSIKVMVMTNNAQPLLRAKISRIPSVIHLDQTHDISMLTKRVFTELQIDYGGHLRGINLSTFLQMMELEGKTCTLQITSKDNVGYLWVQKGQLLAARENLSTGKDAALQIMSWKNVFIDIDYSPQTIKPEISIPLMMLIMESGQLDDEKNHTMKNSRVHRRYDLLIALDYNAKNVQRHCSLRDISLGGAYIETDQELNMDQTLTLTLTSPKLKSRCTIDGTVVRQDTHGVGISFKLRSLQQRQMIQAMISGSIKGDEKATPPQITGI